ncbi:nicotinate-nucleotide--dimethylbenzimidazole phosphoribosyltransferase [Streptomyces sp. NPDC046727]|uniref:nicotinate-nucleotide--dimethylbenzimidazole phosphoribosyltransferase n=1 Tax=Streptomyces sp. NPDC046727 TaxID=3155373 RepID=UPI0034004E4A
MTDTGQVPGEGQPESAGMVEQPGVPPHGAYTYLSEAPAEDEDLLLPGAQGAWGNEVPPPPPEPVVEAVHEPGPHETAGRDSGSVDLSGVRLPGPASVPPSPILSAPQDAPAAQQPPRRPLHLGPPIPDASASPVRSLADRGPAGAPVRQPGAPAAGPEYLDVQPLREMTPQSAAPWGAAPAQVAAQAPAAETVSPPMPAPAEPADAAQAAMARLAHQAATQSPTGDTGQVQLVHGHDGVQPVHGHDGVYTAPTAAVAEGAPAAVQGAEGVQAPVVQGADGVQAPVAQAAEGVQVPVAQGPEGVQVPVAQAADGVQVPVAPGGVTAEGAPVVAGAGAEGVQVADGAQAVPAEVPAGDGGAVADGAVVAEAAPAVAEVAPAEQAVPAAEGVVPEGVVPGPEGGEPGPAPAEVPSGAESPVPTQGVDAQVPPVTEAPVDPAQQAAPAETPDGAQAVVVAGAAETGPVAEPAPVETQAAEAARPAAPAEPTEAAVQPAEDTQPVEAPQTVPPAPDTAHPTDAAQAPDAVHVVDVPQPPADAQGPVEPADPAAVVEAAPTSEAAAAQAPEAAVQAAGPVTPVGATAAAQPDPADAPGAVPVAEPAAAQVPEADAAQPAVPVSAVPEPMEPAVLQAQGPQLAENVPPTTGADAPAGPVVPQQPQAADTADPATAPAGPQVQPQAPEAAVADPATAPQAQQPEQTLGQFVPVEGQVPTTPHLAPTPPQPLVLPAEGAQEQPEPVAMVPAPREGEPAAVPDAEPTPDVVQNAEDLQTRAADQEESTAAVAEARQSTGPAAPGYADAEREAVLKVMRERRDIRNGFRSDPIPHEVLLRVLEAAHTAPSVGHSQPWDFVVIRSAETRRTMHELATRQREAYAKSLPKGRAKQFKELKIEAILDTPVNIVVTADPTRGGRHTLGRHTQPQMAPYSSALAVENLWLAARAEGLGVGWVSFFDEREMVRALGLPEHLEVVAYLCVGYVDEFPDEPELMQAGWSKRRPLSWVVHEETYGRRALPGEEPHDLLAETVAQIRPLDAKALGEAWERQKRMTKPAGALGMLEIISAQLSGLSRQCPPPIPEPAAVAIFAGDHGVHAQGVTPWPQEVTAQMVANFLGGGAVCNAFATQVGAEVCVVDVGVAADLPATPGLLPRKIRGGTSDMTTGPAMTREEAKAAIEVGIETARDLVAAGNKALLTGEMGIANTTASAALISVFTGADPAEVTGRGTGINDETLARKTEVVRRALELHQPDPADPIGVLAAIGGFEHAAMVGLLLGGASLRTPVILDGVSAGAAALVARAIAPEVLAACIAGHRSAEPGHVAALNKLGLRPLVDLDLRLGEGTGALLALPLVQSTARAMHEVATFDSAGVTEK